MILVHEKVGVSAVTAIFFMDWAGEVLQLLSTFVNRNYKHPKP